MTEIWALAGLWMGLALAATLASIWLRAATALRHADVHGADLIVVGDRGRSRFTRLLLGSVSKQVVQYAGIAVLVVR